MRPKTEGKWKGALKMMNDYSYEDIKKICDERTRFCRNSCVKGNLKLLADEADEYYKQYFLRYSYLKSADNALRQLEQGMTYLERSIISMLCKELDLNKNLELYDWDYLRTEFIHLQIKDKDLIDALTNCYDWTCEHVGETGISLTQQFNLNYDKIISHKDCEEKVDSYSFSKVYHISFRKYIYDCIKKCQDESDVQVTWLMADASVALRSRIDYYRERTNGNVVYFNNDCKEELDNVLPKNERIVNMYLYDPETGYYAVNEKVEALRKQISNKNIKQHIDLSKVFVVEK